MFMEMPQEMAVGLAEIFTEKAKNAGYAAKRNQRDARVAPDPPHGVSANIPAIA